MLLGGGRARFDFALVLGAPSIANGVRVGRTSRVVETGSSLGGIITRDNLDIDNSGNLDFTPLDWSTANIDEEFLSGTTASGGVGGYGWILSSIGGAGNVNYNGAAAPHNWGALVLNSPTTSGQGETIGLGNNSDVRFVSTVSGSSASWDAGWIFAPSSAVTGMALRVGLFPVNNGAVLPSEGAYIRYDTNLSDTDYMFCADTSSTETCVDSGITPAQNTYVRLRFRSLAFSSTLISKLGFSLYNSTGVLQGTEKTICTSGGGCDISPAAMPSDTHTGPAASVVTYTASTTRALVLDAFKAKIRALAR